MLIDEALTPDSSRFWPAEDWRPGGEQPSFDKQFVRDYLLGLVAKGAWDKTPPGPPIPPEVTGATLSRYREALVRLFG
jgi:phosphoribosylaminoimidazole-succinocarboxamide synthase